jgi:transposase
VDTIEDRVIEMGRRRRRRHSARFKADAVGACQQPGVSVATVALSRGVNANLLHRWITEAGRSKAPIAIQPTVALEETTGFLPIALPSGEVTTGGMIWIEVRSKGRNVSIKWPAAAAHDCAMLLRELLK